MIKKKEREKKEMSGYWHCVNTRTFFCINILIQIVLL